MLFKLFILFIIPYTFYNCSFSDDIENTSSLFISEENSLYPVDLMYFSQDFYLAVRYEDPLSAYIDTLSKIDANKLEVDLDSHNKKLAFWINIYNSLVQVKILSNENSFKDQNKFFKTKDLIIAGIPVSLDELEHGILRLQNYDNVLVKRFKLDSLDYRIHFTMNCGATSCPAIAYYKSETIQEDLSNAENSFIVQNSVYDSLTNIIETSELIKWFKDDFGGDEGIYNIMINNGVILQNSSPKIKFKAYNWDLKSRNYH